MLSSDRASEQEFFNHIGSLRLTSYHFARSYRSCRPHGFFVGGRGPPHVGLRRDELPNVLNARSVSATDVEDRQAPAHFNAVCGIHPWATPNWPIRNAISSASWVASAVSVVLRVSAPACVAPVSTADVPAR